MKKKLLTGISAVSLMAVLLAGCGGGEKTVLAEAGKAEYLSYSEETEGFQSIVAASEQFGAQFSARACGGISDRNTAVSPVSVYMTLALAAEAAGGETQRELLDAMNLTYKTLKTDFSRYYRSVAAEYRSNAGKLSGRVIPVNSVWVDYAVTTKADRIQALADDYFCSSYSADFAGNNKSANAAVRDYVKKQTQGLIDTDFELDPQTLFTFINTVYLKEVWNKYGDKLPYAEGDFLFTSAGGEKQETKLMKGYENSCKIYETDTFTSCYTTTDHDFRIKFMLPKDGYTATQIFTAENIAAIGDRENFDPIDEENKIHYYARCLFPEYQASYGDDVAPVLQAMGINAMFGEGCDFSPLTDASVRVEIIAHITQLEVNRRGIEGAAVTVLPAAGAPGPDGLEEVHLTFTVDRAFGYTIENSRGITLFAGIVNRI